MSQDEHREMIRELIAEDEFLSWLGVTVEEIGADSLVLSVPASDRLVLSGSTPGMGGTVHAGIVATVIDMAGEALRLGASDPESYVLATTDLDVSYLRPATGALRATGRIRRAGSSMAVSDVTVESKHPDGGWTEVAVGRGSYRVLDAGE